MPFADVEKFGRMVIEMLCLHRMLWSVSHFYDGNILS